MHNALDQLAKKIGKSALLASGPTLVQHEISRDAQHADLLHDPDPARVAARARLGLLGRMAEVLSIFENYGHAPGAAELRACLSKHFAFWEERAREAGKVRRAGQPPEAFLAPFLWILTAGRPDALLVALRPLRRPGWPRGVYFCGGEALRFGIVVASELPRGRSTLLVRLMAAGPLLRQAVAELSALPANAHEHAIAEPALLQLDHALGKKPNRTLEEEEFIVTMQSTWKQAREMGRDEGRSEEAARNLLTVLGVRGIAVPSVARERILAQKDPSLLERWLEKAILAASLGEVIGDPS